jgi:6-phosphogluconolactonase
VYKYEDKDGVPYFEKIQSISTLRKNSTQGTVASALSFSVDYKYLLSSNAGDNSVVVYDVDQKSGMLKTNFCLPISGNYPKDAELFPGNQFLVSLNHESDTMTFFRADLAKGIITMNGAPMKIQQPNCIIFHKIKA